MSERHVVAAEMADKLNQLNQERRIQQNLAIEEISNPEGAVIVVAGKWHEGVLGIIAGRLVEKYHKPAFVLSEVEEGVLKGSGRSFGEFNLAEALKECGSTIIGGGGHAAACGLKVRKEQLGAFRERINHYYKELGLVDQMKYLEPKEEIELETLEEISMVLMDEIKKLEPFGVGNLEPVFLLKGMQIKQVVKMGSEQQHLKLTICDKEQRELKLVAFNAKKDWMELRNGDKQDIWVNLIENEWRNEWSVEGRILQIKS